MNMVILFISGMCMGAGILMSTQYGAKKYEQLEKQISTTLLGGLAFSAALTVLLLLIGDPLLRLLQVPEGIMGPADAYLKIVFVGLVFTFVYNFFSNTLRALGDSRAPLYFLIISAVFNVVLDLVFVLGLEWGVPGSAAATVLSQAVSCLFCLLYIKKKVPLLCLGRKWLAFDISILWRTFSYGITSALQQMCVQLGKICVQTVVNVQGVSFIAAFTAINRVDDFAMTPQQNIAHAATTFMAQNKGAGKISRMKKGFLSSVLLEAVYTVVVAVSVFCLSRRWFGRGDQSGNLLSPDDLHHVSDAGSYKYYTGILPGTWRPEDYTDQYGAEYGGTFSLRVDHDSCTAWRVRVSRMVQYDRMDRNAGTAGAADSDSVEEGKNVGSRSAI